MWMSNCLQRHVSPETSESLSMYIVEFIGTLVVTATFAMVTTEKSLIAAVAVGFVMIALIYAFGHISGAHFNPMISVAVYIRGFITLFDAFIFILMQLTGAFVGALFAYCINDEMPFIEPGDAFKHKYGAVFVIELIYSFTIAIVVINVATAESQRGNFFYGVSIGMAVTAGICAGQRISGGAYNPAIGTALSFTNLMREHGTLKYLWLYWVAPCLGGVLGGLSYYVLNAKEIQHIKSLREQQQAMM